VHHIFFSWCILAGNGKRGGETRGREGAPVWRNMKGVPGVAMTDTCPHQGIVTGPWVLDPDRFSGNRIAILF